MDKQKKQKLVPLSLLAGVLILDQLTKHLVVTFIPRNTILCSFFGDFLRIVHVRNLGAAFSFGSGLPATARSVLLAILPVIVLCIALFIYFRNNEFTYCQRWLICGVLGGGFGNIIDRLFRPAGVVDFIDVKFYGIFGFERWPTFNVADSCIMVCGIWLFINALITIKNEKGTENDK